MEEVIDSCKNDKEEYIKINYSRAYTKRIYQINSSINKNLTTHVFHNQYQYRCDYEIYYKDII